MATSSKIQFDLSELQDRALESIDERIAAARALVAGFSDGDAQVAAVAKWRQAQEERLFELVATLGDISDKDLAQFRVQPMPEVDTFARTKAARELQQLEARRTQIAAKSAALVADEDGRISLTKTQLAEFFDL